MFESYRDGFELFDKVRSEKNIAAVPVRWREPFLGRRRKIGWEMYNLLGVAKGDFEGTQQAPRRSGKFPRVWSPETPPPHMTAG